MITKRLTEASNWGTGTNANGTARDFSDYGVLENTAAFIDDINFWNDTAPTASVFTVKSEGGVNASGADYVGYCFHSVDGFSKVGGYSGNGVTANYDGQMIYTGFTPAFVLIKCTVSASTNWRMFDDVRVGYNPNNYNFQANENAAENDTSFIDFLSNGFKLITTHSDIGSNNEEYLYYAVAEFPFKYANGR